MASRVRPKAYIPLRRLGDLVLDRIQDNVGASMQSIMDLPYLEGNLIEGVELSYGSVNEVAHGLGRVYRGFFPVRVRAVNSSCYVRLSANQSIPTATDTLVQFNTELYDDNGDFDTSTYLFTAPVTARYRIEALARFLTAATDVGRFGVRIQYNGAGGYYGNYLYAIDPYAPSAALTRLSSAEVPEGTTLGLYAYQNVGVNRNVEGGANSTSYFGVHIDGSPVPYEDINTAVDKTTVLPLWCERPATVDLWVY